MRIAVLARLECIVSAVRGSQEGHRGIGSGLDFTRLQVSVGVWSLYYPHVFTLPSSRKGGLR